MGKKRLVCPLLNFVVGAADNESEELVDFR